MKNIYLRFVGLGYRNINQANVFVYDEYNNVICNKKTYNGYIKVCLNTNKKYRVYVVSLSEVINSYFYVTNYNTNYIFAFPRSKCINTMVSRPITFLLKDYYYNLLIEKGNMILWQKQ